MSTLRMQKKLCLTSLNSLYEYLGAKFRYGDEISKIINLQFLHEDINASNITYVNCNNVYDDKIKELSNITRTINLAKIQLNQLINLNLLLEEKENISKMIAYLNQLIKKYSEIIKRLNGKVEIINVINTGFDEIMTDRNKNSTTESLKLEAFLSKKEEFVENIVSTFINKIGEFEDVKPFNPIVINPNEYPYLSYKFVKRSLTNKVDVNYIQELLCYPMKKGFVISDFSEVNKTGFADKLLRYDEERYPDPLEFYRNKIQNKINDDFKSESSMIKMDDNSMISYSDGINSRIYFDILCGDRYSSGIYMIDQPEDDISPSAIRKYLLKDFKKMSKNRQIILITHNPQFVVNLDADNVIALTKNEKDGSIKFQSGALEFVDDETNIIENVANILDGGIESLRKRWKRYEKDFDDN